jgi:caffeoyl-CoA O-methyltransferase
VIDSELILKFVEKNITGLDPVLDKIERDTHLNTLQSHMLSGRIQVAILSFIVKILDPKFVLELGTFTGYSAIGLAQALNNNSELYTIECEPEVAEKAQLNIDASNVRHKITLLVGEAKTILPDLVQKIAFDFVFIDADKVSNKLYYDLLIPTMKNGSVIAIDNILWKGKVVNVSTNDTKTKAIKDFIDYVMKDDRVEAFILPIRDGILFARIK